MNLRHGKLRENTLLKNKLTRSLSLISVFAFYGAHASAQTPPLPPEMVSQPPVSPPMMAQTAMPQVQAAPSLSGVTPQSNSSSSEYTLLKEIEKLESKRLIKEAKDKAGEGAAPQLPAFPAPTGPGVAFPGAPMGSMPFSFPMGIADSEPKVVSIVGFDGVFKAVIENDSGESYFVKEGDEANGYIISKITKKEVTAKKIGKKSKNKVLEAKYTTSTASSPNKSFTPNIPGIPRGNFADSSAPNGKPVK